jgi:adenosylhomocysteine nucleosidase
VELRGVVRPDRPLLVVALQEEADALDDELPILVSGPGKVHAAAAVTAALASVRPASVINIGTAGGLRDGLHGVHDVGTVIQHDFDSRAIRALVNRDYGMPIELDSGGTGLVLATGDRYRYAQRACALGSSGGHGGLCGRLGCGGGRGAGSADQTRQRRRR